MVSPRRALAALCLVLLPATGVAAPCSDSGGQYEQWKSQFAAEARAAGIGQSGIQALMSSGYSQATINADRNQKSFNYTLDKFMQVRGAETIVAQGRSRKAANPGFYRALEARYGVPAGVLLAIHGMETGFGGFMGDSRVVSSILTLAYDCRRSAFFTPHALAALQLVDRGVLSASSTGAKHGEWGHTQFLPGNVLRYGVDGDGNGRLDLTNQTDALASTANFLRQMGWQPGAGYQQGQPNFRVIEAWNAATVYQKAIALMAARIDG
ncbi:lytic transglycosylase domain-containing protein [Palleronia rufa]|uniref:lytic murein transglycosylase n=1 Tax=Palleronia rufa TaxID=1530186 RepID=UPI000562F042|nr:lytic murein transglycosylase [Palleronia rufa]